MHDSGSGGSFVCCMKVRGSLWRKHSPVQKGREHNYEGAESKYKLDASNYIY